MTTQHADLDRAGGAGSPPAQDGSSSAIPREEHERLLAEERKRRAAQQSEKDREITALKRRLDSLEKQVTAPPDEELPDLDPRDPASPHLRHLYQNTQRWQQWVESQETARQQAEARAALDRALDTATAQGVPADALDVSSPDTVSASAKDWLREKSIRDLQTEVKRLREEGPKEADQARREERESLGAARISTATGPAPAVSTVDDQLAAVQRERQGILAMPDGPEKMVALRRANQALTAVADWKRSGNHGPMPPLQARR